MTSLNQKLVRDLWRMKGQALAIASVIATGVLLLVMQTGLVVSLDETRRAYYERYRLADVFAPVSRAPEHLLADLAAIEGVAGVTGRIVGDALVDMPKEPLPIRARILSLPHGDQPRLNAVYLVDGRLLNADRPEEILLLDDFARAHSLSPGDDLRVTINGLKRTFRIVGLARAPEFIYLAAPGEFYSDDGRYAIIWMQTASVAAAYDMEGAFNEALLSLGRDTNPESVIAAADRLLDNYGATGAFGLEDLVSNRFITEEIAGLRATSSTVPPVFLAVAAFLLYIVIIRMIQAEREEIGLVKAFGYSDMEIGWHYLKFVLAIAIVGALVGCVAGILAGRAMTGFYQYFFKFPFLVFRLEPAAFIVGTTISVATASVGGLFAMQRVFILSPAAAMRPPTPPDYSRAGRIGKALVKRLDQPTRMIIRRLLRQPFRMAGAIAGISCAMGLSAAMTGIIASYDGMLELTFDVIDRSHLQVAFTHPNSDKTIYELKRIPGVIEVEPIRAVAAVMRNDRWSYRGVVNGLVDEARLYRAVDANWQSLDLPDAGIVLSEGLAETLSINAGEWLTLDVREGSQPTVQIPVSAVAESLMGSPAFMRLDSLNRALDEVDRVSGAFLRLDPQYADQIYAKLRDMPVIAGIGRKDDARSSLQRLMDEGAGAMRYVMLVIAGVITFGVVYNTARIAQAERNRDLASLRVMGFTKNETAFVLLGELAFVTIVALPIGSVLGYLLSFAVAEGFSTDLYRIPVEFIPSSHGVAASAVLCAAALSGFLVKRDIDRTDLVAALKTRE